MTSNFFRKFRRCGFLKQNVWEDPQKLCIRWRERIGIYLKEKRPLFRFPPFGAKSFRRRIAFLRRSGPRGILLVFWAAEHIELYVRRFGNRNDII